MELTALIRKLSGILRRFKTKHFKAKSKALSRQAAKTTNIMPEPSAQEPSASALPPFALPPLECLIEDDDQWLANVEASRKFPAIPQVQTQFYATDFGACFRKLWYNFHGYSVQTGEVGQSSARMEGGNFHEAKFAKELVESGRHILVNVRVSDPALNIAGRIDISAMEEGNDSLLVLECKATNSKNWESIVKCSKDELPNHDYFGKYLMQLAFYLYALRRLGVIAEGKILVVNFDNSKRKLFRIKWDDSMAARIEAYFTQATIEVAKPEAPPIPAHYSQWRFPCFFCEFRDTICWNKGVTPNAIPNIEIPKEASKE